MRRVLLALAIAVVALAAVEGALSLAGLPTLRAQLVPAEPAQPSLTRGDFVPHPDPRVHSIMQPDAELVVAGVSVRSDELGLRARTRRAAADATTSIVLLGDSVVFGWGVGDDETFAAQLERQLAAAAEPGVTFAVRGVGLPGWNARNATAFLLDHLDRLDPDLVVYVPIPNDLTDAVRLASSTTSGVAPDLASGDPWVHMAYNGPALMGLSRRKGAGEDIVGPRAMGPTAIDSDLGLESRRRYDALADLVVATSHRLAERDADFVLAPYRSLPFTWSLLDRLAERGGVETVVPLFEEMAPEDRLPDDPHPNADALGVMATWLARDLVEAGVLRGMDAALLPTVSGSIVERRAPRRTSDEWAERARAGRESALEILRSRYDTVTGEGARQGFGGIDDLGRVTTRARCLLRRVGDALVVRAEPLTHRTDVPTVTVSVQVDDVVVGSFELEPDAGETTARFAWPAGTGDAVDVTLVPSDWIVDERDGVWSLASFRLLSLAGA